MVYGTNNQGLTNMDKIKKLLSNNDGASLVIVLASMLFLITIASSTLISALGVTSVTQGQKDKAQIELFAESIQLTLYEILHSKNLQDAIFLSVLAQKTDANAIKYNSLTLAVNNTNPNTFVCSIATDGLGVIENEVSGFITINVTINLDTSVNDPALKSIYRFVYHINETGIINDDNALPTVDRYSTWRLTSYEKIES